MLCITKIGCFPVYAKDIIFGPKQYKDFGVPHLYTVQQTRHIENLIRFGHLPQDLTGQLICANLEQLQLEVGVSGNLLCQDYSHYGFLATSSYLQHLWEFLTKYGLTMKDDLIIGKLQCQNDTFLMPTFVGAGIGKEQLWAINRCRLYLRAYTLSDIVTGDGTTIMPNCWEGTYPCHTTRSHCWPAQGKPSSSDWEIWWLHLKNVICHHNRVL